MSTRDNGMNSLMKAISLETADGITKRRNNLLITTTITTIIIIIMEDGETMMDGVNLTKKYKINSNSMDRKMTIIMTMKMIMTIMIMIMKMMTMIMMAGISTIIIKTITTGLKRTTIIMMFGRNIAIIIRKSTMIGLRTTTTMIGQIITIKTTMFGHNKVTMMMNGLSLATIIGRSRITITVLM